MNARTAVVGLVALLAGAGAAESLQRKPRPAPAAAAPMPSVRVAGIRVDTAAVRPNATGVGTRLAVSLEVSPPAGIVAVDSNESTVEEMRDSTGRLLEMPEVAFGPDITKSGRAAMLELRSEGVPAPGASEVTARAKVRVTVAAGTRTERVAALKLQKGAVFQLGGAALTLDEVEAGEDGVRITIKGPGLVLRGVKEMRFLQAGQPVEASRSGSSTGGESGVLWYRVAGKGGTVALAVDLWQQPRVMVVPIDVRAGVGVGQ